MELQQIDGASRQPLVQQRIVGIDEQADRMTPCGTRAPSAFSTSLEAT
jgi:hypothetical protein